MAVAPQGVSAACSPSTLSAAAHAFCHNLNLSGNVVDDIEASRRLRLIDDGLAHLSREVVDACGLSGRRCNAFTEADEPLTAPSCSAFARSAEPDPRVREFIKKQQASVWFVEEIDLAQDKFEELDADTQQWLEHVLAFFAASDGIVASNLASNVQQAFTNPELLHFFAWQGAMEHVHAETYDLLLEKYVTDRQRRDDLRNAISTMPCVKAKAEWAMDWARPQRRLAHRLIAYACVEGIHFSSSFCAIYYLKKRGVMPGLTFSNELISRDEGMHTDFAVLVHSMLTHKCEPDVAHEIIRSATEIECAFVTDSLPVALLGMNADHMR